MKAYYNEKQIFQKNIGLREIKNELIMDGSVTEVLRSDKFRRVNFLDQNVQDYDIYTSGVLYSALRHSLSTGQNTIALTQNCDVVSVLRYFGHKYLKITRRDRREIYASGDIGFIDGSSSRDSLITKALREEKLDWIKYLSLSLFGSRASCVDMFRPCSIIVYKVGEKGLQEESYKRLSDMNIPVVLYLGNKNLEGVKKAIRNLEFFDNRALS